MFEEILSKYGFFFLLILVNKFFLEIVVEIVICNGKKVFKNYKFRLY